MRHSKGREEARLNREAGELEAASQPPVWISQGDNLKPWRRGTLVTSTPPPPPSAFSNRVKNFNLVQTNMPASLTVCKEAKGQLVSTGNLP